ncbi:MAG: hypothetical protein LPL29_13395 [Alphaproteobacteria bacterium]|nr:hypothetical protein [Alphaproteobacteria bacterium]
MSRANPNYRRLLPKNVVRDIDRSGLDVEIKGGSRHWKLYIAGKFVCVIPRAPGAMQTPGPSLANMTAEIKRKLREFSGEQR